eukprot:SAG22_NODE_732_length_7583_cov_3.250134_3_plen_381_part_00
MGCSSCQAITFWDVHTHSPGRCPACVSGPAPVGGKDFSCGRTRQGGACIDALALPIFYNKTIAQQPVDLRTVSTQYASAGSAFVAYAAATGDPFFLVRGRQPTSPCSLPFNVFLYLSVGFNCSNRGHACLQYVANSHVHVPQNHADRWAGKSGIGPFGDALMEMDWEVGEIVAAVKAAGELENTLFLVSGDNGPWECKCNLTGSSGPYVGQWQKDHGGGGSSRKTTLWEGGHRVVGIASWPGTIKPGRVTAALASTLDFLPTIAAAAGVPLPGVGRVFDGVDLGPLLRGQTAEAHTTLFHPLSGSCGVGPLKAQRWMSGGHAWKLMWKTGGALGCMDRPDSGTEGVDTCTDHDPPLLFDLSVDEGERSPIDTSNGQVRDD